jgi:hypothetical protein
VGEIGSAEMMKVRERREKDAKKAGVGGEERGTRQRTRARENVNINSGDLQNVRRMIEAIKYLGRIGNKLNS